MKMPPLSILMIENDRRITDLLSQILVGENHRVDAAYSAEVAIAKMESTKYSFYILDYALPNMKGDELAERIRRDNPEAGILLLTGFRQAIDASRLKLFDFVVDKPASPKMILDRIQQWDKKKAHIDD